MLRNVAGMQYDWGQDRERNMESCLVYRNWQCIESIKKINFMACLCFNAYDYGHVPAYILSYNSARLKFPKIST